MKIEHIAIWTDDIERLKDFYIKYFNGKANKKYINPKKKFESYFIEFESGARIEIMKKPLVKAKDYDAEYRGYAHLAFSVGNKSIVEELTELLKSDGYKIKSEPRTTGDGYYESTILDPDGNIIEITI